MGVAIMKKTDGQIKIVSAKRDFNKIADVCQRNDDKSGDSIYGLQYRGERIKFALVANPKRHQGQLMKNL